MSPTVPTDANWGVRDGTRAASLSAAETLPDSTFGSPYKRQRASLPSAEEESRTNIGDIGNVLSRIEDAEKANGHETLKPPPDPHTQTADEDEEL